MNNTRYEKILGYLYKYYNVDTNNIIDFMKSKENRYVFLLLLKRNNCLNIRETREKMGINNIRRNVEVAEAKLLMNSYFREKYFDLEDDIKKELKL